MNESMVLIIGTLGMLMLVLGIVIYVVIYQRKILKKKEELERLRNKLYAQQLESAYAVIEGQAKERMRIARDVHDNLGSQLSAMRIFSDLLPSKSGAELEKISIELSSTIEEATKVGRGIAHSLARNQFGKDDFLGAIDQQIKTLSLMGNPKLSVHDIKWLELRDGEWFELLRILQELINNTVKHAKASQVTIAYKQSATNQTLVYRDDGIGFDPEGFSDGFGMQSIRQRADIIDAEVSLNTLPGSGTQVELSFTSREQE